MLLLMQAVTLNAQNIGIGTNTPHSSAILDLSSSSKGLLLPRMTSAQRQAIATPAKGLLVYDTDANNVYAFNGVSWTETGGAGSGFSLPFAGTANSSGYAMDIANSGTGAALRAYGFNNSGIVSISQHPVFGSAGVKGISNASQGTGIWGEAIVANAVGVRAVNTFGGTALSVNGALHISGGNTSPGAGKVLTSDAYGNATWQLPATPAAYKVAFELNDVMQNGANVFANGVWTKVHFATEVADYGHDYNATYNAPSSTFTVPVTGMYLLSTSVYWTGYGSGTNIVLSELRMMRKRGATTESILLRTNDWDNPMARTDGLTGSFHLLTGDQVWIEARATTDNGTNPRLTPGTDNQHFSGVLLMPYN